MLQSTVMTPGIVEMMGNVTAGESDWLATNNAACPTPHIAPALNGHNSVIVKILIFKR